MSAERDKKMADNSEDPSSAKKAEEEKLTWTLQPVSFTTGAKNTSNNLAALAAELSAVHCFALRTTSARSQEATSHMWKLVNHHTVC